MASKKGAGGVTVIGGADGPTSIFLAGHSKKSVRQKIRNLIYRYRKKKAVKSMKANPHSMDELMEYMKEKWGFLELSRDNRTYQREYKELRASFLLQYKPELLGELAVLPELENRSEEAVKALIEQVERRQKAAEEVPKELFDIECHILEKTEGENSITITLEKTFGCIGASASGTKGYLKKMDKIVREIYLYYGVSQKDIDEETKRYKELIAVLAGR